MCGRCIYVWVCEDEVWVCIGVYLEHMFRMFLPKRVLLYSKVSLFDKTEGGRER